MAVGSRPRGGSGRSPRGSRHCSPRSTRPPGRTGRCLPVGGRAARGVQARGNTTDRSPGRLAGNLPGTRHAHFAGSLGGPASGVAKFQPRAWGERGHDARARPRLAAKRRNGRPPGGSPGLLDRAGPGRGTACPDGVPGRLGRRHGLPLPLQRRSGTCSPSATTSPLGRLDSAHYDLLASEACLTSFLAVARGDVPPQALVPARPAAHPRRPAGSAWSPGAARCSST